MSAPVIGNLHIDPLRDVAQTVAVKLARLTPEDGHAYLLLDRKGNLRLLRPTMRDAEAILHGCKAREIVGTYTKAPASAAMIDLIAGDLAEALR